ncbi:hypothetical protein M422DRAFT_43523 [Sphaerobolus stellatus SS14]|nr:hypothetical protein M422DRAFT_43523 [Sphaerobolus stellatus SS14]
MFIHQAYQCYNPKSHKIVVSHDVIFPKPAQNAWNIKEDDSDEPDHEEQWDIRVEGERESEGLTDTHTHPTPPASTQSTPRLTPRPPSAPPITSPPPSVPSQRAPV